MGGLVCYNAEIAFWFCIVFSYGLCFLVDFGLGLGFVHFLFLFRVFWSFVFFVLFEFPCVLLFCISVISGFLGFRAFRFCVYFNLLVFIAVSGL